MQIDKYKNDIDTPKKKEQLSKINAILTKNKNVDIFQSSKLDIRKWLVRLYMVLWNLLVTIKVLFLTDHYLCCGVKYKQGVMILSKSTIVGGIISLHTSDTSNLLTNTQRFTSFSKTTILSNLQFNVCLYRFDTLEQYVKIVYVIIFFN